MGMIKIRPRKAFTLIELLVVIAIIALLLSIILPSLKRVKEAGKRTTCMANLRSLSQCLVLYANDNDSEIPSATTSGSNAWVDHVGGALPYYNLNENPQITEQQKEAIRRGLLWPYCSDAIGMFRCPTTRLGNARSYSMPDSFNWDGFGPLMSAAGTTPNMYVKRLSKIRNSGGRMLFIDEGWATPLSWSIIWNRPAFWDLVPEMHGFGTNLAFVDGHVEYWKWADERTREFAREAMALENPQKATYWRETMDGNEDIRKLVTAVYGNIGW